MEGFRIYTEYCNGHTQANVMLQELVAHEVYAKFFEECRNRRGMQPIPLDGYLLTPVQRICKYPLQLNELYKYTKVRPHRPHATSGRKVATSTVALIECLCSSSTPTTSRCGTRCTP